jgi:hypothetical protein
MEQCKYCDAGYARKHDEMIWFKCGSYYGETNNAFGRGTQCYSNENKLLKGELNQLHEDMGNIHLYVSFLETELIDLRKRLKSLDFESTPDGKSSAEMLRIVEAKP